MKWFVQVALVSSLCVVLLYADGIPEPGIILFGSIANSAESNTRLTFGSLSWTITQSGAGARTFNTVLNDLPGGLSYRLRIPYESSVGSSAGGPVAFILNSTATEYGHSGIQLLVGGTPRAANIVGAQSIAYVIGTGSRAMASRINLSVNAPGIRSSALSNLPSPTVEQTGSGTTGSPQGLPSFQFTRIEPRTEGGVVLQWQGAPANREYLLLRAQSIESGSEEYEVVRVFPASPSTVDSFLDPNTINTKSYFYKLVLR